jgi:hypothetical protein
MNTYRVEFMSRSNRYLIIKTTVQESSVEKVESCAYRWLTYWMGLKPTEFEIYINTQY